MNFFRFFAKSYFILVWFFFFIPVALIRNFSKCSLGTNRKDETTWQSTACINKDFLTKVTILFASLLLLPVSVLLYMDYLLCQKIFKKTGFNNKMPEISPFKYTMH